LGLSFGLMIATIKNKTPGPLSAGCLALSVLDRLQDHPLGTDQLGHDLASLVSTTWDLIATESLPTSHRRISMAFMVLNR
jgi:hypothetical protein